MNPLKISLVQTELNWEDPTANREMLDAMLEGIEATDLVVLPEMFTTGFSMQPERLFEKMNGDSMEWMRKKAAQLNTVITGSLIIEEEGKYFNRLIWMRPDGTYEQYDKRHLFSLAKEDLVFKRGEQKLIVDLKGWKICPLICYDLRFPVWSRNIEDYDILLYIANFPAKRRYAWRHLLRARAIENQCYVLGVNIVGKDGNDLEYSGDSCVIDPWGKLQKEITDKADIIQTELKYDTIENIRKNLQFLKDRDHFEIIE